jgi:type I restriction enzyme R subunit
MTPAGISESTLEDAVLVWLAGLGYQTASGLDIAPGEPKAERNDFGEVILRKRLRNALERINPNLPADVLDEVIRKATHQTTPKLSENNRLFHRMLVDGVDIQYQNGEGRIVNDKAWLVDFNKPENNDWFVVNQFTVIEDKRNRRADVVVFLNGLPLGIIELKNPGDGQATIKGAYNQLQTYKNEIPSMFVTNGVMVISDGLQARAGTITADFERFMPWRTIDGEQLLPRGILELEGLIKGIFEKKRLLDLLRYFVVFEVDGDTVIKKMAGYHQFHAVNKAVNCTVEASSPKGDKRAGVIWHTQGSGKSLSMVFYAGKIIQHPVMENPTLVVLTDRNDLDDQLFGTFSTCQALLRQTPVQAENRDHLRDLLKVASGGVIFTTIQKFAPSKAEKSQGKTEYPLLSDRRNIVFIADEAHRSQYDFIDGFARHMRDALPNASFIGFTGTPIELSDKSTTAVFGDCIDVYDIVRAVEDGATVPIYYEGRLAKIELNEDERPHIDPEFEEITENEEQDNREKLKSKWAKLEAMVGTEKRINLVAQDIVDHFEKRRDAIEGKGMIVCMSRRICVDLYNAIIKLRPDWHNEDDEQGFVKVVMTGSASDDPSWQQHIRTKSRREGLAKRFKKPNDEMKLVIVRDMWLTGYDAPSLHTMYVDKPMRGHGLMQAIARVNRVFKDKPGGLVVDYLGIADELKKALSSYTEENRETTGVPIDEAVAVMKEKYEIVSAMFHGLDYSGFFSSDPIKQLQIIPEAQEHILSLDDGKNRFLKGVSELTKAFALVPAHDEAIKIRDDVKFFQTIRAALMKTTTSNGKPPDELDTAIRQIISKAVSSDEVIDIFSAAGLKKPDLSILSDEFLAEVQGMQHKNLALELLKKLLNDEIKLRSKKNLVQARSFSDMLELTIKRYQNRTIESAQVIAELIELAKDMREAHRRGEETGLTEEEVAFYDALEVNDSAVKVLGDDTLRDIARELVELVRQNTTIDWTKKESVKANLRRLVKRVLRKYGYPPDKQEKATQLVLEQAELLCENWF